MDKRVQGLWADALESDEFKQARGNMSVMDEEGNQFFCCLAVLCELYRRETGDGEWKKMGQALPELGEAQSLCFNGYTTHLPGEVCMWAGLDEGNPVLQSSEFGGEGDRAVTLNDNMGYSFKQIAKLVREL